MSAESRSVDSHAASLTERPAASPSAASTAATPEASKSRVDACMRRVPTVAGGLAAGTVLALGALHAIGPQPSKKPPASITGPAEVAAVLDEESSWDVAGLTQPAVVGPPATASSLPDVRAGDESIVRPVEPAKLKLVSDRIAALRPVEASSIGRDGVGPAGGRLTVDPPTCGVCPPGEALPRTANAAVELVGGERSPRATEMMNLLIASELPGATDDEIAVWREVLAGLSLQDARGILRMRSQIGGASALSVAMPVRPLPLVAAPSTLSSPQDSPLDRADGVTGVGSSVDAFAEAAAAARRNLHRQGCLGHLAEYVLIAETEDGSGVRVVDRRLHDEPGPAVYTGRPLDVAMNGAAFLQVKRDGEPLLTRYGRLAIADDGTVGVELPSGFAPLHPAVAIDPDALCDTQPVASDDLSRQAIAIDGEIVATISLWTVADVGALERAGAAVYRLTEQTGPAVPFDNGFQAKHLTGSNVVAEIESERLAYMEGRLREHLPSLGRGFRTEPSHAARPQPLVR